MTKPDRRIAPEVSVPGNLIMPPVESMILANGARLACYSGGDADVNSLTVAIGGGTAEEEVAGLTSLTNAVAVDGTATMTSEEIAEVLDFNGSWTSGNVGLHRSTRHFFSLNSRFDDVLPVIADIIESPVFPDHESVVGCEKSARQAELEREKERFYSDNEVNRLLKGRRSRSARVARPDELRALTANDLRRAYRRAFNPLNMTVYLSGRLTPHIVDAVASRFGAMKAHGEGVGPAASDFKADGAPRRVDIPRPGALQSAISAGIATPVGRRDDDYEMLRIAVVALGGYFGSRLMLNIREDKGYTYGIGASLMGYPGESFLRISTECDNRYADSVIDEIRAELLRLQSPDSFNTDEIERLRSFVTTLLTAELDSPFAIMNHHAVLDDVGAPADYFARQQRALASMTPESLAGMARRYLSPENLYIAVAGDIRKQTVNVV